MELKVGMKLRVRPDFKRGDCDPGGWVRQFEDYRGKVVTVRTLVMGGRACRVEEDIDRFTWGAKMFTLAYTSKYEVIQAFINEEIDTSTYQEAMKEFNTNTLET